MPIVKKSFLSNLLGSDIYNTFKDYAKIIVPIGTFIIVVFFIFSFFVHWDIISHLLNLVTGTSLLFIIYIGAVILHLDFEVDIEIPEKSLYCDEPTKIERTTNYKFTIFWGVLLLLLGIAAIYFSNEYRRHYSFECTTFLVDKAAGVYHLDCNNYCEYAAQSNSLVRKKGYEIEKCTNCTLCEWCDDWAKDAEYEYASNQYFRK